MTTVSNTKAFAYYRTSSATNVGIDKDSRARQESAVLSYASAHDINVVEAFADEDVRGDEAIDKRPAFGLMLKAIAGNGVKTILVETANRFARDMIVQETGHKFLRAQGIDLIAVDSPQSFLSDTPTAVLVRQILGAVAQFEKAALVARLAAARRRLGRPGGQPRLQDCRPEVIARARDLRSGWPLMPLREVSRLLASEGYLTGKGKAYAAEQVSRMLK